MLFIIRRHLLPDARAIFVIVLPGTRALFGIIVWQNDDEIALGSVKRFYGCPSLLIFRSSNIVIMKTVFLALALATILKFSPGLQVEDSVKSPSHLGKSDKKSPQSLNP